MNCSKCKNVASDYVVCGHCEGRYHYDCAGVSEVTYRKMGSEKKANWRCISCRNLASPLPQSQSSNLGQPSLFDVLNEIKSFRVDFNNMKTEFDNMKSVVQNSMQCITDINNKLITMDGRFDDFNGRLITAEKKISCFSDVQKELIKAQETIFELRQENNLQDQFSRQNNIEISGLPANKGENLMSTLHDLCTIVGFKLCDTDVDTIHRVRPYLGVTGAGGNKQPARPPSVVVRFTQRRRKDQLIAAVRSRRGITTADIGLPGAASTLYVSDHLTPTNKLLLKRARELKVENNYSYLWVKDCKILLRKNETSNIIRISNESDLHKIK